MSPENPLDIKDKQALLKFIPEYLVDLKKKKKSLWTEMAALELNLSLNVMILL